MIKTATDTLCERMLALRQFAYVDSAIADADDQIVLNLIEEHQSGSSTAGGQMLSHAQNIIDHLYRAGFAEEDEVFLAEVAIDEAIAAERVGQ